MLNVTAGQYVLVTFHVTDDVPFIVTHTDTNDTGYQYVTLNKAGDKAGDTTGVPFTQNGPGGPSTNVVTGLDVATNGVATQAVLGDGYIDQAQTGKRSPASTNLAGVFTAAEPSTPQPYGSLSEGIESNQVMADYPEANGSGPSLLSSIDRDVLDQPGLSTVVLDEGLEDVLAGHSAQDLYENGFATLIGYLGNLGVGFVAMGLTPCDGYAGDGANPNDACTAGVDAERVATNHWLSTTSQKQNWFYIDSDAAVGVPDTGNGEVKLDPNADGGDHVNMTDARFGALSSAYLAAQDTWKLNDGSTTLDPTTAADSASNLTNPYLAGNPLTGNGAANLEGGASWAADDTFGNVLSLNGTTGDAVDSNGQAVTTTGSFSVSAWAKLSDNGHDADIVSQDGGQRSGFELQYEKWDNRWSFVMASTDGNADGGVQRMDADTPPTLGVWTHLVGVYDASNQMMSLYVNGVHQTATGANVHPVPSTGPLAIGRGQVNGAAGSYFAGSLSTAQVWDYALTPAQITGLYKRIS